MYMRRSIPVEAYSERGIVSRGSRGRRFFGSGYQNSSLTQDFHNVLMWDIEKDFWIIAVDIDHEGRVDVEFVGTVVRKLKVEFPCRVDEGEVIVVGRDLEGVQRNCTTAEAIEEGGSTWEYSSEVFSAHELRALRSSDGEGFCELGKKAVGIAAIAGPFVVFEESCKGVGMNGHRSPFY